MTLQNQTSAWLQKHPQECTYCVYIPVSEDKMEKILTNDRLKRTKAFSEKVQKILACYVFLFYPFYAVQHTASPKTKGKNKDTVFS